LTFQSSNTQERAAEHPALDRLPWLFLILGSFFRVSWPLDMEWKGDEKWMFAKALAIASNQAPWPWIGMPSGVGLQNPGLSIWPFALLAHVAHDPVAMAQAVQWINVKAGLTFAETGYDALSNADALVVVTDWNEYRHPDFARIKQSLRRPIIVDGRNLYALHRMSSMGFISHSIGRPAIA